MTTFPFSTETAQGYYAETTEILADKAFTPAARLLRLRGVLAALLRDITANEPQIFTDLYSRLLYVADKHALPDYLVQELHAVRRLSKSLKGSHAAVITEQVLSNAARGLALAVFHFSDSPSPEQLSIQLLIAQPLVVQSLIAQPLIVQSLIAQQITAGTQDIPMLRVTVIAVHLEQKTNTGRPYSTIEAITEDDEAIIIQCWDVWSRTAALVWQYATLHCFNVSPIVASPPSNEAQSRLTLRTTNKSLLVLEPDYLVDVTDIAECVQINGSNPRLSLLKKFCRTEAKSSLIFGSIINHCFDALITNIDAEFEPTFNEALLQRPVSLAPLLAENADTAALLNLQAQPHFQTIRQTLMDLHWDAASVEPSFMAPDYGLQGRLDLMLEYQDDPRRKTVIELKAGSPPEAARSAAWSNNAAQVACYNLLLDAAFGDQGAERSGDSCILYSRDAKTPLRNIPNDRASKQTVLAVRNELIATEHALCDRKYQALRGITPKDFGLAPSYSQTDITRFYEAYNQTSSTERRYFHVFTSFVARENWSARLGSSQKHGFSALWLESTEEKESSYDILSHLSLNHQLSDLERMHLWFDRTERTPTLANFRQGDVVILNYELRIGNGETTFQAQTLKGSIKELSAEYVVVSLRNKQFDGSKFQPSDSTSDNQVPSWSVEHDFFGTEFKSQYESLFDFLAAPPAKRELLLGLREPYFESFEPSSAQPHYADLTDEQNARLVQAMSARDYFLLQGPPGTGKTSRMIRSMAQHLFANTDEHFILLAFTNRAVDEICAALKSIREDFPFIRLGGKESSVHQDRILFEQIQGKSVSEVYELLRDTRVIVSTISSLLKTPELLAFKRFQTAIVDEASQVVEPQLIGLLTRFGRFILVGDEKQLPAVVTQQEAGLNVTLDDLNALGIKDLRVSLFERLISRCKQQGWTNAFGIIARQGRMHRTIQEFPNRRFYGGQLQTLSAWQEEAISPDEVLHFALGTTTNPNNNIPKNSRLLFFPSRREDHTKVHNQEAERAARLVAAIHEAYQAHGIPFTNESIGVITPFRAQIAAIHRRLMLRKPELHSLVSIDTVERYQGSERDIIIISFAVNHASQLKAIQSLSPDGTVDRKLNVALTRARKQLIALGCVEVLAESEHLRAFVEHVRERGGMVALADE